MKQMKEFTIPFAGLKQGEHHFEFKIDTKFFTHFEYEEFHNVEVLAKALLVKNSNSLEFHFEIDGTVNVNCDVTNEPYDQVVYGAHHLVVNFGQDFNEDDDSLIIIPHNSHEINIAQYIYELIVLSLPTKLVHPGIEDGTLDSEILRKLEELTPKNFEDKTSDEHTDSRWEELKKLLTDK
ncbi:MAG: hypothetical protein CVU03_12020 [Bacteroidetes bacterium HGW-Bacteroidetes-2]|jgi:uncharacterized metal-binding protein YceD (DUF177 family)|nr:MAG: hypothetical protein CVU03_12020 [Bacteroidetes bacterium HGW-Bacteroidetes-2]